MKKFIFACNFKMNVVNVEKYMEAMKDENYDNVIICPNFCDIKEYTKLNKSNNVFIGAQNVSEFEKGAHTGEISAEMLANIGAQFCIVGHSERKKYNTETLIQTNEKVKRLIENNITPIICVGEELYSDLTKQEEYAVRYVLSELNEILKDVDINKVIIAYEPIWAIGTNNVASPQHINSVLSAIKKYTNAEFTLYGGSFGEKNYEEIAKIDVVDGALIGGASLKPELICKMQKRVKEIYEEKANSSSSC